MKKICRNAKTKKTSIDESYKGFKKIAESDSKFFVSKRRNSSSSRIKLKGGPNISENSRSNSKIKLILQSEKKIIETKEPNKLNVKTKKNMIKPDKNSESIINLSNRLSRTQSNVNYINNRIETFSTENYNNSIVNQKESRLRSFHKKSHKSQKITEPSRFFQEPQPIKVKEIFKKVRFADLKEKCNYHPSNSHSMSSILISDTEEWVNPKISPPSLLVSDFVKEFGQKILGKLESDPKIKVKKQESTNEKIKNFIFDKISNRKPHFNLNFGN